MKKILLIVFLFLGFVGQAQDSLTIKKLIYVAEANDFFLEIIVTPDMYSILKERKIKDSIYHRLPQDKQTEIFTALKNVNADILSTLAPPSQANNYEGAAKATFKICTAETVYESRAFDHGNPPAKITEVVNLMESLDPK